MKTSKQRLQELAAINNPFVVKNEEVSPRLQTEASSAKETDADTLKQVIRKANSYDSDAIVAIEDGYYGIADNLPSLIESLQKVVDAMKDDVGGVIPGGSGKLVEAAENELKIYEEIQALLDLSAVGKLL